jgi:hypothetical protein
MPTSALKLHSTHLSPAASIKGKVSIALAVQNSQAGILVNSTFISFQQIEDIGGSVINELEGIAAAIGTAIGDLINAVTDFLTNNSNSTAASDLDDDAEDAGIDPGSYSGGGYYGGSYGGGGTYGGYTTDAARRASPLGSGHSANRAEVADPKHGVLSHAENTALEQTVAHSVAVANGVVGHPTLDLAMKTPGIGIGNTVTMPQANGEFFVDTNEHRVAQLASLHLMQAFAQYGKSNGAATVSASHAHSNLELHLTAHS